MEELGILVLTKIIQMLENFLQKMVIWPFYLIIFHFQWDQLKNKLMI